MAIYKSKYTGKQVDSILDNVENKQNILTPGRGIDIQNDVISLSDDTEYSILDDRITDVENAISNIGGVNYNTNYSKEIEDYTINSNSDFADYIEVCCCSIYRLNEYASGDPMYNLLIKEDTNYITLSAYIKSERNLDSYIRIYTDNGEELFIRQKELKASNDYSRYYTTIDITDYPNIRNIYLIFTPFQEDYGNNIIVYYYGGQIEKGKVLTDYSYPIYAILDNIEVDSNRLNNIENKLSFIGTSNLLKVDGRISIPELTSNQTVLLKAFTPNDFTYKRLPNNYILSFKLGIGYYNQYCSFYLRSANSSVRKLAIYNNELKRYIIKFHADTLTELSSSLYVQNEQNAISDPDYIEDLQLEIGEIPSDYHKVYNLENGEGKYSIQLKDPNRNQGTGALGERSISLGANNTASGYASHAEGYSNIASGSYSHAEGKSCTASGEASHAEGYSNTAEGAMSHVEGAGNTTSLDFSHAEGSNNTASGMTSHAEGEYTTASGSASHAEGKYTIASEEASHSEGYYTIANNKGEHSEGIFNVSNTGQGTDKQTIHSVGIGTSNSDRKNAVEIMQNGDYYMLGVGGYQGTNTKTQDATVKTVREVINGKQDILKAGTNISIENGEVSATGYKFNTELQSFAEFPDMLKSRYIDKTSYMPPASITFTGAAGSTTYNVGGESAALLNESVGMMAFKIGDGPIALLTSYDLGSNTATFDKSLDENNNLSDTPFSKVYMYIKITFSGDANATTYSFADMTESAGDVIVEGGKIKIGNYPIATIVSVNVENSTITLDKTLDPDNAVSNAMFDYIILPNNTASGYVSHAEGYSANASGPYSHAEGGACTAYGIASHAEGSNNNASGDYSHAEGYSNTAEAMSHAEGSDNIASGSASHAEGKYNTASGGYSHAEGYGGTAEGAMSHVEGDNTTASGQASHADGSNNNASGDYSHAEGYSTTASRQASHAEGSNNNASGNYSHAEGESCTASGEASHAEGYSTTASKLGAHAEGDCTNTLNQAEHSEGKYNISIQDKTIHTVGIGNSENTRKNAHEIHIDGKHYIYGIGGYDGTNSQSNGIKTLQEVVNSKQDKLTTEISWSDLKSKRDNGALIPGMQYRITDYVTTTIQANTQSAGHPFDVIVTALDTNKLSEIVSAIQSTRDTNGYFSNSNLVAWQLWYCLDNDTNRFSWADSTNGKGVVYYMKDEWGNECPYDFKNIQFKRFAITKYDKVPSLVVNNGDNTYGYYYGAMQLDGKTQVIDGAVYGADFEWLYTFALKDLAAGTWHDYTVVAHLGLKNDEGHEVTCYGNKLSQCRNEYNSGAGNLVTVLNDVVFMNCYSDLSNTEFSDGYSYCYSNVLADNCSFNTFGNSCYDNIFGNNCSSNIFGNSCYDNISGNYCLSNTFGNNFFDNIFGNNFSDNIFGNDCSSNIFGNSCYDNIFGNNCSSNIFGNYCYNNIFGNYCLSNTFGNVCYGNTFRNESNYNIFRNGINHINIQKDYVSYIIIENGNKNINITSSQTTSSANPLRNFTIAQGVNNATTTKTISHNTVGDTFKTTYQPANSSVVNI